MSSEIAKKIVDEVMDKVDLSVCLTSYNPFCYGPFEDYCAEIRALLTTIIDRHFEPLRAEIDTLQHNAGIDAQSIVTQVEAKKQILEITAQLRTELAALKTAQAERNKAIVGVLEDCEWSAGYHSCHQDAADGMCPSCSALERFGHSEDCQLTAAIRDAIEGE